MRVRYIHRYISMLIQPRALLAGICAIALAMLPWQARSAAVRGAEVPVVAAAADLQYALAEIVMGFTRVLKGSVRLAFGSSGNLARQIMQGAPFELFFSADETYVRMLVDRGLTEDRGALYAIGRLALFVPAGSRVRADAELRDLAAAAGDGRLRGLAIANPEHAPYGRAARETLVRAGLWEKLRSRLVLGENVSQATQFALSGSVEAALTAYSLAISEGVSRRGSIALVPEQWHGALRQRMVLLRGAGETARVFYAYVQSPAGRAVLERYGFSLPVAQG